MVGDIYPRIKSLTVGGVNGESFDISEAAVGSRPVRAAVGGFVNTSICPRINGLAVGRVKDKGGNIWIRQQAGIDSRPARAAVGGFKDTAAIIKYRSKNGLAVGRVYGERVGIRYRQAAVGSRPARASVGGFEDAAICPGIDDLAVGRVYGKGFDICINSQASVDSCPACAAVGGLEDT